MGARFLRENAEWLDKQLLSARTFGPILAGWHKRAIKNGKSYQYANSKVRLIVKRLRKSNFCCASEDEEIRDLAEALSKRYSRIATFRRFDAGVVRSQILEEYGIELPKKLKPMQVECALFWRRQLRKVAIRTAEQINRELGNTRRGIAPYVSDWGLRRWLAQHERNRAILESVEAENDLGQIFTLDELANIGISNPEYRRGELMVRMRGFEEYAQQFSDAAWTGMFYTWTCPSKYHPRSSNQENPKYQGATPIEAQAWLNAQWSKARADLQRKGIPYYGFRVAEPHHDGCPHWHMLLFVPKGRRKALTQCLRKYVMAEDGRELGARKYRFKAVTIDPRKGGATGYIAKYVAKNIDGHNVQYDEETGEAAELSALRVRAWASIWGIRQFQQVGGPPVTVYRESRRAARPPEGTSPENEESVQAVLDAADRGDWCDFTIKMGGAVCRRAQRPLQIAAFLKGKSGRYGDEIKVIRGLWGDVQPHMIQSRFRTWTIRHKCRSLDVMAQGAAALRAPPARPLEFCQ